MDMDTFIEFVTTAVSLNATFLDSPVIERIFCELLPMLSALHKVN